MKKDNVAARIKRHIEDEIQSARFNLKEKKWESAFYHLERAHVLGQSITTEHTRIHWLMLRVGWQRRDWHEVFGQILRILGASTKTPFGIYPTGNTGGANVSPFRSMPIASDLLEKINDARKP